MPRFVFKLQPVLDQRRRVEDDAQRELAQLLRQRMIFQQQLRDLQGSIRSDKATMTASLTGHVDVSRIREHARHAGHVTQRAQQLTVSMLGLERRIETARGNLLEATKRRKAIELLRDKQQKRWETEQRRREATQLDEIATAAHVRRMRGAVA